MAAAITTAAIGVGMAGFQAYQGHEQARKAKNALQDYNRQDLNGPSPYENIPINTVGTDIMREESQRTTANTVDALRNMGTRGAAMLPGVIAQNNRANQETRGYIDGQIQERANLIARDKSQTRSMTEARENADLAGIGNQMMVGQQNMWSGIRGVGNAAMNFAGNYKGSENPQVDSIGGELKPIGISPYKSALPTASLPDYSRIYKNGF